MELFSAFSAPTFNIKYVKKELSHLARWIIPGAVRTWKIKNPKILSKNTYYLFFLFFKHLVLKDILSIKYYKQIFKNYNLYLYNYKHSRYYFLFFFLLLKYKNYVLYNNIIKAHWKIANIYFYNNHFTFFLLFFFNYSYDFFYNYDKFLFYDNFFTKTFFFFDEFTIKTEAKYFVLYRHYFEHFRRLKYNEYLSTHKSLQKFSLLKKILHAQTGKPRKEFVVDFRKNILFKEPYNIYKFEESSATEAIFQYDILFCQKIHAKLQSIPFFKFFKLMKKNFYLLAVSNFKALMGTYLLLKAYHLHYLFNRKKSYWRYKFYNIVFVWVSILFYKISFDFIEDFFKYFYKFEIKHYFKSFNLFNYGFLYHNYFNQSGLIKLFLQKNYLMHRVLHLILIESILPLYGMHNWVLDIETENPRKRRSAFVIKFNKKKKYIKKKDRGRTSLRIYNTRPTVKQVKQVLDGSGYPYIRFSTFAANEVYRTLWTILLGNCVFEFCDVLNCFNEVSEGLVGDLFNVKYIIEFFLWETFHKYDKNDYVYLKYSMKSLSDRVKIDTLIINYTCRFFFTILFIVSELTQRQWVNRVFFYFFFKDLFIKVLLKHKGIFLFEDYLKNNNFLLLNKFKIFHYKFFLWQIFNFFGEQRFWAYYKKNEIFYND